MSGLIFKECGAEFSAGRDYRYSLFRRWGTSGRMCNFLMLNPSTADENDNDPTVERCERRAHEMGYDGLVVTNIFALRSTDPRYMLRNEYPVGAENDAHVVRHATESAIVICAWGKDGGHRGRSSEIKKLLSGVDLYALKVSPKTGEPFHPLYLSYKLAPFLWRERQC